MKRTFTCIVCPNGCEIDAEYEGTNVLSVTGNLCPKGKAYVTQELIDPRRTIASSVRVLGGTMPLASVRLNRPVPKDRIFDVMAEIRRKTLQAPVRIGDVVIENVLGLGSDVLITKNVEKERA
jgi:CxxC motif-containing protein